MCDLVCVCLSKQQMLGSRRRVPGAGFPACGSMCEVVDYAPGKTSVYSN